MYIVLATNRPEDLDSAVLDRIDVSLCVGMPEERERAQLIRLYHSAHFQDIEHRVSYLSRLFGRGAKKLKSFKLDDATVASIAASTAGFSGREISKVFIAMQYAVLLTQDKTLTESMMRDVLEAKLKEHEDMARFLGHRSGKEQSSVDVGVNDDSESAIVNDSVAATGRTPKRSVPQRPAASGRDRRRSAAEHTVPSEEG
jgi:ATPase family AAA domain-containing protein 3A/B